MLHIELIGQNVQSQEDNNTRLLTLPFWKRTSKKERHNVSINQPKRNRPLYPPHNPLLATGPPSSLDPQSPPAPTHLPTHTHLATYKPATHPSRSSKLPPNPSRSRRRRCCTLPCPPLGIPVNRRRIRLRRCSPRSAAGRLVGLGRMLRRLVCTCRTRGLVFGRLETLCVIGGQRVEFGLVET
jgi:hypothetical protein